MLMTVEDLRKYIATEETDEMLAAKLKALELAIRKYTNNNFMVRGIRTAADAFNKTFTCKTVDNFKVGDTVQVSMSDFMDGLLCTVAAIEGDTITVNEDIYHEEDVLITKVEYPEDVKMGVVNILKWQLRNDAAASGDKSAMPVQSESISRHSVTYAQDSTEADLDADFGVPKKHIAFLKAYHKARF